MDVGEKVPKRRGSKALNQLSTAVQNMMGRWTEDNFTNFQETMELIREGAPVQWAKLYMEAVKLGIERNMNINININERQKDREDLQALVRTKIHSLPKGTTYTPFEEVREKEELERKKEEESKNDDTYIL